MHIVRLHSNLDQRKIFSGDDAGKYKLLAEFVIEINGLIRSIPVDFIHDGSSVPWGFRNLIDRKRTEAAGLVHDHAYRIQDMTRKEADILWREIAGYGEHKANVAQAWLGYYGLRVGGWVAWRNLKNGKHD